MCVAKACKLFFKTNNNNHRNKISQIKNKTAINKIFLKILIHNKKFTQKINYLLWIKCDIYISCNNVYICLYIYNI